MLLQRVLKDQGQERCSEPGTHIFGVKQNTPQNKNNEQMPDVPRAGQLLQGHAARAGQLLQAWLFDNMVMEDGSHLQKMQSLYLGFRAVLFL